MIRRCDPQLEFIYRLFSGMHIHTSGDSLSSDMRWQREYKRQIDIPLLAFSENPWESTIMHESSKG